MDLLDLFAKITLDTSGYEQGLSSAIAAVQNFSSGANSTLNTAMSNMANTVNNAGSDMADAIGNASTEVNNSQHQIAEHAEEDAESFSKSWNNAGNNVSEKLKSALGTIAKVSAAAIGTATAGIAALTKSAVENFGEYEQLVGGVETLFKNSADTVQQYAANAYKTAGLSANAYMETVTSFSASLLQSLGGDTAAAAEVADRAITDMSDNANKMGTDMQMIQNAYQGFAKQNYTMLDNLKLGYGGTKEEMQRLLDTANEYNRQQGINTDYQIENYADIVEAIHVVQTEMGITGTTAAEAATTIQGSLSSMGSAWQNLVTGIADENADFETLIDNFVDSAATALDNLLPRVKTSLEGIGKLVTELSPIIAEAIPELVNDVLPSIIQAAVDLVTALVNALVDNGDMIANTALDILDMLVQALVDNAFKVADGATSLITTLVVGISQRLPDLIPAAVEIILAIAQAIIDNIDEILEAAEDIIRGLADGLMNAVPVLLEKAGPIVISLLGELVKAIPDVIDFAVELCFRIAEQLFNYDWKSVGEQLHENISKAIEGALRGDSDYVDRMAEEAAARIEKYSQLSNDQLTRMIATTSERLNEYNAVWGKMQSQGVYDIDLMPDWMKTNFEHSGKSIEDFFSDNITTLEKNFDEYVTARDNVIEALNTPIEAEFNGAKIAGEAMAAYYAEQAKAAAKGGNDVSGAISASGDEITETTKKTGEKQKSVLVQNMEALERLYKQRELTEDQYNKARLEYLEKHRDTESDEWTKYYDQVQTYYEKLADTEQKAAEKAAQEREKNFRTILDAYSKQVEQLQNKIDTFADKLTGAYKDFYTFETDEEGNITSAYATDKMAQAGKQLEEYYNQLLEFQERGIGGDMISQLADFSQEEGLATLEYWNSLTDEQIKNLQAHYDKVTELSHKVSEVLHAGEAESTAEAFANEIAGAVENDEQFKAIGELMLSGIIDGLNNGAFDITEAADRIYGAFDSYFQGAGTVTPPSYTPTTPTYTAAELPAAERTSGTAPQKAAGDVPIQGESGINVTINIQEFNNYTEDDIDTLARKVLNAIQDEIIKRKAVYS